MTLDDTRKIWDALDGHPLGDYVLSVGRYSNGRISLGADGPEGPECTLTVNLVDHPLDDDEFYVRLETRRRSESLFQAMIDAGIAHPTERVVSAGFVKNYAEIWKFSIAWQ